MADLNSLEKQIEVLAQATTQGFKSTNEQLGIHEGRFDALEKQIDVLAQATANGFGSVAKQFEKVDERFDTVDQKLERIERRLDEHGEIVIGLDTRVGRLEKTEEPVV